MSGILRRDHVCGIRRSTPLARRVVVPQSVYTRQTPIAIVDETPFEVLLRPAGRAAALAACLEPPHGAARWLAAGNMPLMQTIWIAAWI